MLALAGPRLPAPPPILVVVLDASASMAAGTRWQEAIAEAQRLLREAPRAAAVRAGLRPETLGPGKGAEIADALEHWQPGDAGLDVAAALAAAGEALPGAPVAWIGDTDPGPPAAFYPVGGGEENAGITHLTEDFLAVGHSGEGPSIRQVRVDGEVHVLALPARGFRTLRLPPKPRHEARLLGRDDLSLDDRSTYRKARPRVALEVKHPALLRLLALLGVRPGNTGALAIRIGVPTQVPEKPTLFFAPKALGEAPVADREAGHPFLLGAVLLGERLAVPPPPGAGFSPLAVDDAGRGLLWSDGKSLYLPPLETLVDRPFFPVLVYNFFAPHLRLAKPLGTHGVLTPGDAYVLEKPEETLLRPPPPARPLETGTRSLSPALFLVAAILVLLESRLG